MQLGDPTVLETSSSGEAVAAPVEDGGGGGGGGDEGGEKSNNNNNSGSFGGNRWPRQETLALLKIRSDMDAVFRDSSLKGPLWDEVSRKLGELGYQRSAKKCKEKFENVYKYHKRTKERRSTKPEGKKTYKFFDQLQALEHHQFSFSSPYPPKPQPPLITTTNTLATLLPTSDTSTTITITTATTPISHATIAPSTNPTNITPSPQLLPPPPTTPTTVVTNPKNPSPQTNNNSNNNNGTYSSLPNMNNLFSSTTSSSSSTASDEDLEEKYRKKRKWKDYFRRLTRQVLAKQEEMQKKFLEAIDKREREQAAQQDAWRMQEMARINREHEILVQERSTAAAKDAAVITFLHKLSGQQPTPTTTTFAPTFLQQPPPPPPPQPQPQHTLIQTNISLEIQKVSNGHGGGGGNGTPLSLGSSSSRWPKAEVHALIRLRTSLDAKYQDNGPKAPLWEDISAGMQRLGYSRSAKRCKEKWENINKYFKKVKESKKQRREDSKTCPYFQELDALYREKNNSSSNKGINGNNEINMEPLMVQPEQQWRPPPHEHGHAVKDDGDDDNNNHNASLEQEEEEEDEDADDDDDGDVEEEEGGGDSVGEDDGGSGRYEIATNKLSSVATVE